MKVIKKIAVAAVGLLATLSSTTCSKKYSPPKIEVDQQEQVKQFNWKEAHFQRINSCSNTYSSLTDSFYIFVGKKERVTKLPSLEYDFDGLYCAEYEVIENIYNDLSSNKVKFLVADHYGTPRFAIFEYVLLFLGKDSSYLYHEKYQFFDVYQNDQEEWASIGNPYKYESKLNMHNVKAIAMKFPDDVKIFRIHTLVYGSPMLEEDFREHYPAPYFTNDGNVAIPLLGTPVDSLIKIKREGILAARGISLE